MLNSYDPPTYGDRIAGVYDEWYSAVDSGMVSTLADLAGQGPALELGIGTGRVALPLAARGVEVHGLDASEGMVARLREKPGGAGIPVTMGDFSGVAVEGRFRLVYVVFNTFFALLSQEAQVRCFRNAAERLTEDGVFALEVFVPDVTRFLRGQNTQANRVSEGELMLDLSMHDPVEQRVNSRHVVLTEQGVRLFPVQIRYAWPCELDLMAQLAGLSLRHRWGGWDRRAFTAASTNHVSVYAR